MTKARIARLIELETTDDLKISGAIELGRLRQEFEMWEPEAATPAPANPIGVATSGHLIFPNANQSPPSTCTCKPWCSTLPPPPCPVHGQASTLKVTC